MDRMLSRSARSSRMHFRATRAALVSILPLAFGSCGQEPASDTPQVRPVRTVAVEKREAGSPIVLTGRIESADEAALGFRVSGRMIERAVNVGDRLAAGQLIARLEPQNEMNALRAAQANLAAAQAARTEASNRFDRQKTLLGQGWTTRAIFDQAEKARVTAEAQVDAAEAQLKSARDLVGFTELTAD